MHLPINLLDEIFGLREWMIPVLVIFYFVPVARTLTAAFSFGGRFVAFINRPFGILEHIVGRTECFIVSPYLVCGAAWHIFRGVQSKNTNDFVIAAGFTALVVAGFIFRILRKRAHIRLIDFLSRNPTIHPQEFFDYLFCCAGIIEFRLPNAPRLTIDPTDIDFRSPEDKEAGAKIHTVSLFSIITGIWSTVWITKLAVIACRQMEKSAAQKAVFGISLVWSGRTIQLLRAAVKIEGKELLPADSHNRIFVFTHGSFLDFTLVPLVLAARIQADPASGCVPIFLAAKDHFRDNPIFYRFIGIGRAAEVLGMVFVDRRPKDKAGEARRVANEAAEKLVREDATLVIFPQGTRAAGFVGFGGERLDAGYYTVAPRGHIRKDGRHLKKGAAFISAQAATEISSRKQAGNVKILPVAIKGAATACPRGSMKIQAGVQMKLVVGEPIVLDSRLRGNDITTDDAHYQAFVNTIHSQIDGALKKAASIHALLERRFFEDMRSMHDPMKIEELSLAMKTWRGDDYLFHATLDAIYSCRPKDQRPLLGELAHLLLNFATRDEIAAFKSRAAEKMTA